MSTDDKYKFVDFNDICSMCNSYKGHINGLCTVCNILYTHADEITPIREQPFSIQNYEKLRHLKVPCGWYLEKHLDTIVKCVIDPVKIFTAIEAKSFVSSYKFATPRQIYNALCNDIQIMYYAPEALIMLEGLVNFRDEDIRFRYIHAIAPFVIDPWNCTYANNIYQCYYKNAGELRRIPERINNITERWMKLLHDPDYDLGKN